MDRVALTVSHNYKGEFRLYVPSSKVRIERGPVSLPECDAFRYKLVEFVKDALHKGVSGPNFPGWNPEQEEKLTVSHVLITRTVFGHSEGQDCGEWHPVLQD